MRRSVIAGLVFLVLLLAGCTDPEPADDGSPYVDQEDGEVRGLSAEEIDELRTGAGMGLARPAELNGYPGPLHVLELSRELDLSDGQRIVVAEARARVLDEAVSIGEEIIAAYGALDEAFRAGAVNETVLREHLAGIEALYAQLRFVHLRAHLETRDLLTPHQIVMYRELRGYEVGEGAHAGHAH